MGIEDWIGWAWCGRDIRWGRKKKVRTLYSVLLSSFTTWAVMCLVQLILSSQSWVSWFLEGCVDANTTGGIGAG